MKFELDLICQGTSNNMRGPANWLVKKTEGQDLGEFAKSCPPDERPELKAALKVGIGMFTVATTVSFYGAFELYSPIEVDSPSLVARLAGIVLTACVKNPLTAAGAISLWTVAEMAEAHHQITQQEQTGPLGTDNPPQ